MIFNNFFDKVLYKMVEIGQNEGWFGEDACESAGYFAAKQAAISFAAFNAVTI